MLRFCKEVFSILHSLKKLLASEQISAERNRNNYVGLILKQFKDFILKFSISGSFFSEK